MRSFGNSRGMFNVIMHTRTRALAHSLFCPRPFTRAQIAKHSHTYEYMNIYDRIALNIPVALINISFLLLFSSTDLRSYCLSFTAVSFLMIPQLIVSLVHSFYLHVFVLYFNSDRYVENKRRVRSRNQLIRQTSINLGWTSQSG